MPTSPFLDLVQGRLQFPVQIHKLLPRLSEVFVFDVLFFDFHNPFESFIASPRGSDHSTADCKLPVPEAYNRWEA